MIAVGAYGFSRGDPNRLLYPTDSKGNLCGQGDFKDRPNLLFFDLVACLKMGAAVVISGCPTTQVCVSSCPNATWMWYSQYAAEQISSSKKADRDQMICKYNVEPLTSTKTVKELVEDEDCAPYYVSSKSIVGRCVPSALSSMVSDLVDKYNNTVNETDLTGGSKYMAFFLNAQEYGMKILQDVRSSWHMILIGLVIAMLVSFLYIVIMRWIAGLMVWITIFLFVGLFAYGTYYSVTKYLDMKDNPDNQGNVEFTTNLDNYTNLADTWLALSIICGVVLGITLILLIFLRKRILIAIAVIKSASRAVGAMIFTLFWPLIPFILQVFLFFFWGATAIYLASSGSATYSQTNSTIENTTSGVKETFETVVAKIPCDPSGNDTASSMCNFLKYGGDEYTTYLQFYQLFMLFWMMNFIVALGQVTLAGAFASYYWAFDKANDLPPFPMSSSLWRALRYHLGSIAFGSLIIAIIQIIRVILEYVDHKLNKYDNAVVKFLLKCLKCCFWCLEKFMKFLNKNAYILIAVYGKNFCTSAKNAFFLILRNIVRVVVIDKVTGFLLLIGKLVIVGIVGILAFIFFSGDAEGIVSISSITDYMNNYKPELNFYLVPVIIIIVGTYVIASGFFSVYSMGVDTVFLCFLEDLERNDGSAEKPYYMSKDLMGLLGKTNKVDSEK
ncbi:hypothetical protein NP493_657g01053 [Ridgeia piscesae]|uniref:Choline transporter-like protein n=1 Tax=Ridgeia piscesae TaxID=27915 RepID=A0AAD9KS74_RIDPI|nr:hypothetical protein NP493_657g01053 [Ridgeia piscesae]